MVFWTAGISKYHQTALVEMKNNKENVQHCLGSSSCQLWVTIPEDQFLSWTILYPVSRDPSPACDLNRFGALSTNFQRFRSLLLQQFPVQFIHAERSVEKFESTTWKVTLTYSYLLSSMAGHLSNHPDMFYRATNSNVNLWFRLHC